MADLHFPARREELTVLTQEQADYISSKLDGLFKGAPGVEFLRHGSRHLQASSGSRRVPRWSWSISSRLRFGFRPTAVLGV